MSRPSPARLVKIDQTKSKGRGVFAETDIEPGTLILAEEPILRLDPLSVTAHSDLLSDFKALPKEMRNLVLDLEAHDPRPFRKSIRKEFRLRVHPTWERLNTVHGVHSKHVLTAFNTNAVGQCLSLQTALMNHSCLPNAYVTFDETNRELTVHALCDIKAGEEVCISQLEGSSLLEPMDVRRERLLSQRGFTCICDACVEVEQLGSTSDVQQEHPTEKLRAECRELIHEYWERESDFEKEFGEGDRKELDSDAVVFLANLGAQIVELMGKLRVALVDTQEWYETVISWYLMLEDKDTAEMWQERMLDMVRTCVGENSSTYRDFWNSFKDSNSVEHQEI